MNDIQRTARLARYRGHVDMGMAGYESDMDQREFELVSPRHAMRMDDLPLSARLKHMTLAEFARLAGGMALTALTILLLIAMSWVLADVAEYGLLG